MPAAFFTRFHNHTQPHSPRLESERPAQNQHGIQHGIATGRKLVENVDALRLMPIGPPTPTFSQEVVGLFPPT